ncbi:MAG: DNA gyrase subunit A [Candidatus Gracilibacteria bacterium]|nr:DNA gyrase subunit A [Candidatus Gracilibacteria bacterium]
MSETPENIELDSSSDEGEKVVAPAVLQGMNYDGDSNRNIVEEMETCYLDYAMSVIVSRALPDIRDGLKPVHRRVLYAMYEGGVRATGKYRKSARVVGDVLGKYHPHGDSSVYEAMVRMAQDFSLRYPLVDGQGNFGSMDGDGAAAMRYTEVKMDKLGELMLMDIEKNTVDWKANYDASTEEPMVLPARIPNLLLNGVMGIAVGMATNIPPHNLGEIIDALTYILGHENPENITIEDLMNFIHGPDFPTGGIIYNKKDILEAYARGRGSIVLRGRVNIEEGKNGRESIVITEVPYQLNKKEFVEKIADLVMEKIIVGVADIRDESNKEGIRVVIELKRDAFPKKILNQLYKLTSLQTSFSFNMIALTNRGLQPRLFNLKEMLVEFIAHRDEVVVRRTRYDLAVAEARAHILEGLKIALDNIDAVIRTIRGSKTKEEAHSALMENFGLSEKQATAIMEMQLQRLAGLERKKIEDELAEKIILIADLKDILANPVRVKKIIGDELLELKEKYGDARRTEVHAGAVGEFNPTDTIPNEEVVVAFSKNGYIKRVKSSSFRAQRRGGKGITTAVKDEDEIASILSTKNHNTLLFFTNTGRVFRLPAYEIPEMQRTAKGQPIVQFLSLAKDESISAILDFTNTVGKHLFLISAKGVVKRIDMSEIANIRASGLIVMKPHDDDMLRWVRVTDGTDNILMVSRGGKAIQFAETDVRVMGRAAAGVRGMKIANTDSLIEGCVAGKDAKYVFTVSENGMGKISSLEDYREQGRGGSGVKVGATTEKTGQIIGAFTLNESQKSEGSVILISKDGQTVRVPLADVRITGRTTQGVILAKLKNSHDAFTSATVVDKSEGNEDEDSVEVQVAE